MQLCSLQLFVTAFALISLAPATTGFAVMSAFQPYILGQDNTPMDSLGVQLKLQTAGFDVLGTFSPAQGYETVAFTHPELKKEASKASVPMGAVLRASLVKNGGKTELSYCDPHYWAYASGLEGKACEALAQQLESALGKEKGFGSAKGMNEKTLRSYQYKFAMPKLNDVDQLGTYSSFSEALQAVNTGMEASSKVKEVYSLEVDDNTRMVGVSVLDNSGSEETILGVADRGDGPKLGGLYGPYEIFIKGGQVSATRGRFRIAVAFPDLSMGTFMKIVAAPGAILDSLQSTTA